MQSGDVPGQSSTCLALGRDVIADRKGKRPMNQDARPFLIHVSPVRGYPSIPIPPIYILWMWLFNCPNTNRDEILFHRHARTASWADFLTMKEGAHISTAVVDAWSVVLNAREKAKGWGTPTRLFASTTTIAGTVVGTVETRDERIKLFQRRLDADLQTSNHVGTTTLDMGGHFYVMSINCKQYKFDILDCSSKKMTNEERYHDAPVDLLDMLSEYVENKHQVAQAIRLRNLRPKRMQMPWRDPSPHADSGVFAMRYMESFTGQDSNTWRCGLQRGNGQQINSLRKRITHNILLAQVNQNMQRIATRVGEYDCNRSQLPAQ
nr:uncharacterized protein LOC109150699 isoform X6 [Ipomoea trifida]